MIIYLRIHYFPVVMIHTRITGFSSFARTELLVDKTLLATVDMHGGFHSTYWPVDLSIVDAYCLMLQLASDLGKAGANVELNLYEDGVSLKSARGFPDADDLSAFLRPTTPVVLRADLDADNAVAFEKDSSGALFGILSSYDVGPVLAPYVARSSAGAQGVSSHDVAARLTEAYASLPLPTRPALE